MKKIIDEFKKFLGNKSFTTKEANEFGISSRMLSFYVGQKLIERIGRGVYIFPDYNVENEYEFHELALTAKSINNSVICLISALSYWDITDEFQKEYWFAIPNNYIVPKKRKNTRFIRPRDLETGVIEKKIANVNVKITTAERSICDAFKYLDEETAVTSLRQYLSQEEKQIDIPLLLDTGSKLKCRKLLRIMKEIVEANAKDYPVMNSDKFKAYMEWLSNKKGNE